MRLFLALLLPALLLAPLLGEEAAGGDPQQLARQLASQFQTGSYAEAEKTCAQLVALQPKESGNVYNLACAQARQGKAEAALESLKKAMDLGFSDAAHAMEDEDLAALREKSEFKALVAAMKEKPYNDGSPYEAGKPMPGLKTIENSPPGGLRYRIRMSESATAEKPHKVVVWLHPSGGSADNIVEPLSTSLAAHGYALVVFTQKQYRGWSSTEMQALGPTMTDIVKVPGLDAKKPVLMGFSAGGQVALSMWSSNPLSFSGLMLSAAYPIDQTRGQAMLAPPAGDAATKTPIFALVGGADQGGRGEAVWRKAEPSWTKAGVPLTLRVVPNRGHEFLFGGESWQAALKWLDDLRDGATGATAAKPEDKPHEAMPP